MSYERSIEDIVETLRNAKRRHKGCTLLIGAGCSVKAGIPSASGFVELIRDRYPLAYNRAHPKTYPKCMAQLLVSERRDLISEFVDKAKVNWAHICIALLMQAGYVDRILTTNFDHLCVRACAMLSKFPATYDFAASQYFSAADIPEQAIFYLHGQRTGFVLMNTDEDFKRHTKLLKPVFQHVSAGRVWIVAGYSGDNDPVFLHLAKMQRFDNGLYWIGYRDAGPPDHVRKELLAKRKSAFYTNGFDADSFFIELAQRLSIFPPSFIEHPFSHLADVLDALTPYTIPGQKSEQDVTVTARRSIEMAIEQFEQPAMVREALNSDVAMPREWAPLGVTVTKLLMAGDYGRVTEFRENYKRSPTPELAYALSWAYVMLGNKLSSAPRVSPRNTTEKDEALLRDAIANYEAALNIKPNMEEALNGYAVALTRLATILKGEEGDRLFSEAAAKYESALTIQPVESDALENWASMLSDWAKTKTGKDADTLFRLAIEKFQNVVDLKHESPSTFYNYGVALGRWANNKNGLEADTLFSEAIKNFRYALALGSEPHTVLLQWGLVLFHWAQTKTGKQADSLFAEAAEKNGEAWRLRPDDPISLTNWSAVLTRWAESKEDKKRNKLFRKAQALMIKAERVSPGSAAYNLACFAALRGNVEQSRHWLARAKASGALPSREELLADPDLAKVRKYQWFLELINSAYSSEK